MKKVCIVNFNMYCLFNPKSAAPMGGAELDMYTLAMGLCNKFSVSIVTGDWGQKNIEKYGNISVFKSIKLGSKKYLAALFRLWFVLMEADSDVYISSAAGPEVGIIALYCIIFNRKFIYRTAHDIDCNGEYIKKNGLSGKIFKFGLLHSHKVIISVNKHALLLKEHYKKLKHGKTLFFIPLAIEIKADAFVNNDKKSILWIARGVRWKQPDLFLDLAEKLRDENFVMIMPEQKGEAIIFQKIKNRAMNIKNLVFIGGVPFKDIQQYFDEAKIFVNTSDYEGFTYTLIQSGIAKVPVVYFNVNPDEVITKYNMGYVSDGKESLLFKQVEKLSHDDVDWQEKSENAHKYVRKNHDIKVVVRQWEKIIGELIYD